MILADASGARIMVAAGGLHEEMDSYRARIAHLVKVGGWSQMRYQRRRGEARRRRGGGAGEQAFAEAGVERILLAGRQQMMIYD